MGNTKSLMNSEAIEKIKELTKNQVCLFCTLQNGEIISRPMATMGIDEDGTIWFFSNKNSNKNAQVKREDTVYLMYMNESKEHYLTLTGYAQVVTDHQKTEELWSPIVKAWFEGGKDDPELSLVKVNPLEGHYWDTKNGKLVSTVKIAIGAITGKQMDIGMEGDLKVKTH